MRTVFRGDNTRTEPLLPVLWWNSDESCRGICQFKTGVVKLPYCPVFGVNVNYSVNGMRRTLLQLQLSNPLSYTTHST